MDLATISLPLLMVAALACASSDRPASSGGGIEAPTVGKPQPPAHEDAQGEDAAEAMGRSTALLLAIAAVRHRLADPAAEIKVVDLAAVTWPTAALGCPREGEVYAQVVTPGFRVRAQAAGEVFTVHTSDDRAVVCGAPTPVAKETRTAPLPGGGDGRIPEPEVEPLRQLVAAARVDLAARLEAEPGSFDLLTARPVTWPDGSLGCPEPGMMYTQALAPGFQVRLRAGGVVYHYHAGDDGEPFLCEHPKAPAAGGPADR